jgi:predicted AlkP superfamily pyrophosphatase or phosphodiesterase
MMLIRMAPARLASLRVVLCCAVVSAAAAGAVVIAAQNATSPNTSRGPKLAVILVVDQMRADYVARFKSDWTGGLKRLVDEGAWFSNAAYPYLLTETCPGHSTIATGTFPRTHGAIGNEWWDRERARRMTCTDDPSVKNVGYAAPASGGDSANHLQVPTFADEMRTQRKARIVSVAGKARAAASLAGHGGDIVAWLNGTYDRWDTSTAFSQSSNAIVASFVRSTPMESDAGKSWTRLLAPAQYRGPDNDPDEGRVRGWGVEFPHVLATEIDAAFRDQWHRSPFADAYIGQVATAALTGLNLGAGDSTDVLAISFSATDWVGHKFGPDSQEVEDTLARLDAEIGELFQALDRRVGRGNYIVALSADHGVTPIPERAAKMGKDAGRLDIGAITRSVEAELAAAFGPGKYVADFFPDNLNMYFAPGVYDRIKADANVLDRVQQTIMRAPGIAGVFTADSLRRDAAGDRLRTAATLNYFPGRSGDLIVAQKPGWLTGTANTAGHGNASDDDQRVPILLMGPGVKHGEYKEAATPADIAPTLAALCGITMAHAEGHVLRSVLAP